MSIDMALPPGTQPEPGEHTPKFPYNHLPYTHIHPNEPGPRPHVLFRNHDCWCEPLPFFIWGLKGRPVAILMIHRDEKAPNYPAYKATTDAP